MEVTESESQVSNISDQVKKFRKTRWGELSDPPPIQSPPISFPGHEIAAGITQPLPALPSTMQNSSQTGTQATQNSNFNVMAVASAAKLALEKMRKAAVLQKQVLEQIQASRASGTLFSGPNTTSTPIGTHQLPRPLKLDKYGREIDDEGKVVQIKPTIHSTLKINLNRMKEEKKSKEILPSAIIPTLKESKWFDSNINTKKERKRTLQFVEAGTYIKQEQQWNRQKEAKSMGIDLKKMKMQKQEIFKRDEARLSALEKSKTIDQVEGDFEFNPNLIPIESGEQISSQSESWECEFNSFEWWDQPFISQDYALNHELLMDQITNYVQHPYIETSPGQKSVVQPVLMFLTPLERKKLRRRRRQDKERDKQDKIRMGITPPPPPKVKLANLMRVLGDAAVADPSNVEKDVQMQMMQRMRLHEERNQERKLKPAQRSHKKEMKWKQKDCDRQALLFTLRSLSNKKILTKIDLNAKQVHLSGCCISCPDLVNIVIVEGGPKSIKFFKKLMLRRLQWTDPDDNEIKEDKGTEDIQEFNGDQPCRLIWEGVVHQKSFSNWRLYTSKTEVEAKQIFKEAKAEHYWERALNCRIGT